MHWDKDICAVRTQIDSNLTNIQIWDQEKNKKLRSVEIPENVVYWRWIDFKQVGIICKLGVYHFDYTLDDSEPIKMFNLCPEFSKLAKVLDYQVQTEMGWAAVVADVNKDIITQHQNLRTNEREVLR
jgi:clathrin heavy chain